MRKGLVCMSIAMLSLGLAPMASQADDVQDQLQRMEDRMAELEDRLQATNDQLDAANDVVERQQTIIDRSGIANQTAGSSGVAAFLDSLELGGWLAGSYWYNFNHANGENQAGVNTTAGGLIYPFHPDSNSFQVDQLWFEMERPVTESQRAGFRADICFGKTCDILSNGSDQDGQSLGSNDLNVYQAYVQYLAPIGEGVTFKFGKFGTLMGAEVAPTVYNFNITRGNVYALLQPITQVGILAEMEFGGGFHGALGYINEDVTASDVDLNINKGVIGRLGWSGETFGATLNGAWGSTNGALANTGLFTIGVPSGAAAPCVPSSTPGATVTCSLESDKEIIADLVLTWDPTPEFSAWLNADYRWVDLDQLQGNSGNPSGLFPTAGNSLGSGADAWGIAIAGRYAITEALGMALRGEWVKDNDSFFSALAAAGCGTPPNAGGCGVPGKSTTLWSITGTADYSLTEQLLLRGEVRYDWANVESANNSIYWGNDNSHSDFDSNQLGAGVEVIYNF